MVRQPSTTLDSRKLERALKAALKPLAQAERARQMQAYVRGQFEFLGIQAPELRAAARPVLRRFAPGDAAALLEEARALWGWHEREYQYAAIELLVCHEKLLTAKDLKTLLELVQMKSWWETVDSMAMVIGRVVRRERKAGGRAMDGAVRSGNLWVRRVAMIHQLGWRAETDTERLFGYAERLAPEKEFFIRKAIGWALRDFSKHDAGAVRAFLAAHKDALSPLSYRGRKSGCGAQDRAECLGWRAPRSHPAAGGTGEGGSFTQLRR